MTTDVAAPGPVRRRWSLQTRLIITVVSVVSGILIAVGLVTGTYIGTVLQENLDAKVRQSAANVEVGADSTAQEVLLVGRQEPGTLLVVQNRTALTGAYVTGEDAVVALSPSQLRSLTVTPDRPGVGTVVVPGLGEYRVIVETAPSNLFAMLGLPMSEVSGNMARIAIAVALVTAGGLLLLAAAIALIIRRSLRPLAAVADTATRVASLPLAEGAVSIPERVAAAQTDDRSEIGRVGAALNTLLDHVDMSLQARQRNEERMRAFVADASHELRTPLASIRGYSELSLRALGQQSGELAAATTAESLERIQAQSLRMSALVEDLLLLARLDEGTELVYGAVDLSRLAVDAVSDARAAGADHRWVLEVPDKPVVVAGDAARLHQVAANLLANARVHTPAGTTVTTSLSAEKGWAVLRVHDDGPGIDPSLAAVLFERFSRGDASRARRTGGTGLGLSIAKAIVTAHDGEITVRSVPGATTFEVRLPARPADPTAAR